MRRLFEIDCADDGGTLTVGETVEGHLVSLTLADGQNRTAQALLDEEEFKALSDLRYKLDFPPRAVKTAFRLSQTA